MSGRDTASRERKAAPKTAWLTENLGFKALSVLFAVLLWYMVNFTGSAEVVVAAPVRFDKIPGNYDLLWESANTVSITLSGQKRVIKSLAPDAVSVAVDLSRAKPGESFHQVTLGNLSLPPDVQTVKIAPNVIRVHLEEIISRKLAVRPNIVGEPRKGWTVAGVDLSPESVIVSGVKRFIVGEHEIHTEPINIDGISRDMTFTVKLDTAGGGYRLAADKATVTVRVKPRAGQAVKR